MMFSTVFYFNKRKFDVYLEFITDNKIKIIFPYHFGLKDEIKSMEGASWNPTTKCWTVANTPRNIFTICYLEGKNPYKRYDDELVDYKSNRPLYDHQLEAVRFILTRKQCILAMEMRTGKTLCAIEALEYFLNRGYINKSEEVIWIGPKSALVGVYDEFKIWNSKVTPVFYTYERFKSVCQEVKPKILIIDEASRAKTPTSQRTKAIQIAADELRKRHTHDSVIILMTGTPAPKSPLDWWSLAEIACPGYLKEGTYTKFRNRLGLIVQAESVTGAAYPKLVTWWDDVNKCSICGKLEDDFSHGVFGSSCHSYRKSTNEIENLYKRLKGLVHIKFKKDCLSLPEKRFKIITCKPSESILRAASLIKQTSPTTIKALTLLRELSDGFQYKEKITGKTLCPTCNGNGTIIHPAWVGSEIIPQHLRTSEENRIFWTIEKQCCMKCNGRKEIEKIERTTEEITCPKDDVVKNILDEYSDVGRTVFYGGFTGTIDRLCKLVKSCGWEYVRVDGRGWASSFNIKDPNELYKIFKQDKNLYEKVAFVAQPGAGGMGIDLSISPVAVFYSNDFNGESRLQAVERIHGPKMDLNRGSEIIDIIHLDSDLHVLNNLNKKRDLQLMTLGELQQNINFEEGIRYL